VNINWVLINTPCEDVLPPRTDEGFPFLKLCEQEQEQWSITLQFTKTSSFEWICRCAFGL